MFRFPTTDAIRTNYFIIVVLFLLPSTMLDGQVSLLSLQKNDMSYRQVLKEAKKEKKAVLAILYSPTYPLEVANEFSNIEGIVAGANVLPVVIDWANAPFRKPQKDFTNVKNPSWMYIHYEGIIMDANNNITNDDGLTQFLISGETLFQNIEIIKSSEKMANKEQYLLDFARACSATYDTQYASKVLDDYIKRLDIKKISNKALLEIIRIGSSAPYSKRLNKLIYEQNDRMIMLGGLDTVLNIQQAFILDDLKTKGMMEPYFVWERYEKELGYDADSLFRRFAISFFGSPPVDMKMLYAEAFDYINYYPRSSWTYLDSLYNIVVSATSKKEDLEILLDLISFQIFREASFRQLDYKAVILYKLGQTERAIGMMEEINSAALSKGIRYKSMLYAFR